jgi:hypothetical protein
VRALHEQSRLQKLVAAKGIIFSSWAAMRGGSSSLSASSSSFRSNMPPSSSVLLLSSSLTNKVISMALPASSFTNNSKAEKTRHAFL